MIDLALASLEARIALALANFALCTGIGWSCLCRIAAMSRDTTLGRYRLVYVLMVVAASASGFAPLLFREWPGPGQTVMALACLMYLAAGASRWRAGPPDYARTHRERRCGGSPAAARQIRADSPRKDHP